LNLTNAACERRESLGGKACYEDKNSS